jgi:hypothetical protein
MVNATAQFLLPIIQHAWSYMLVPILIGVGAAFLIPGLRARWLTASAALLVPPTAIICLYLTFSRTGCSGGDCTGPMILIALLLVPAAFVFLAGLGLAAATLIQSVRLLVLSGR